MFAIVRNGQTFTLTKQEMECVYRMMRREHLLADAEKAFDGYAGYHSTDWRPDRYRDDNGNVDVEILSDIAERFTINHDPETPDAEQWQESVFESLSGYTMPAPI